MPLTSGDLKTRFQAQVAPGNDALFYDLLGEADQRLLEMGNWRWTRDVSVLTPDGDMMITLPAGYQSVIAARLGDTPADVVWEDFEYYVGGPGEIIIDGGNGRLVDRGLSGGSRIYFVSSSDVEEVTVMMKRSPVATPSDGTEEMLCPVAVALKQMMMAIIYENNNDLKHHSDWRALALQSVRDYEASYRGAAKQMFKPSLTMPIPRRSLSNFP